MEPELASDEKEAILRVISRTDADHFLSLFLQLFWQNRFREIIDLIKDDSVGFKFLDEFRVTEIYLEAAHKLKQKICLGIHL